MISKKLRQARMSKGLSQEEVASKLKIARQSISKWENGHAYPDIFNLKLLCDLYEISVDSLLKDDEEIGKISIKDCEEEKTHAKQYDKNVEMLFLLVIMIVSCIIPFLGVPVSLAVLIYKKKMNKSYTIIFNVILILCLVLSLVNSLILLNELYFHIGEATII